MAAAVVSPHIERRPAVTATLFEISDHLITLLDSVDVVRTADERTMIEHEISEAMEAEVRRVDGVAQYLAFCEDQQAFAATEIRRLHSRKQTFERKEQRLKEYVQRVLERCGKNKLEGRTATLALRACPASVEITDAAAVPEEYKCVVVEETVDKRKLKPALEAGIQIPGARLVTDRKTVVRR
jgi:hypothetical protein